MDIKRICRQVLNESVLIQESSDILNEIVNLVEDETRTFEWDLTKEKLDKSRSKISTKDQAMKYLELLLDKVKNLPEKIKIKIIRYTVYSIIGLVGLDSISNVISMKEPELSAEVLIEKPKKTIFKNPTKVSDDLLDFLKYEEGSIRHKGEPVLKAYDIGDGSITVGWGHAELKNRSRFKVGERITRSEAERLFKQDVREAENSLNHILKDWESKGIKHNISQGMYDSMVSMIFNMGIGNFRMSDFIQLVKNGKYKEAEERILSTNVTYPGHVTRRQKESQMFGSDLNDKSLAMNLTK